MSVPEARLALRRQLSGLYAITPEEPDETRLLAMAQAALAGGARLLQYRDKLADAARRLRLAGALRDLCRQRGAGFIVNDDVALALQADLPLRPEIASKAERGYNLFLDTPLAPFKARPAAIDADMSPVGAFRAIALNCLEHFQRNEQGLLSCSDPEFVHQARVALRRLRSAIKLFAPILPADFVAAYGQTWQTLASALGEARNWDVFLSETLPPFQAAFPSDKDGKRLQKIAQRKAKNARKSVTALLAVDEYPRLLLEFTAAVYTLGETLPLPLEEFARQQLARHARKARQFAKNHADLSSAERHTMRIAFKKLRYTLEFLAPLATPAKLRPYLAALARLQDELGQINDCVTAESMVTKAIGNSSNHAIQAWISGRHALLIERLDGALQTWLAQRLPR